MSKKNKIPVLMVTGSGDNLVVDIERYDLDSEIKTLNGYIKPEVVEKIVNLNPATSSLDEKIALARDFMGGEYLAPRLRDSFPEVGKTLASIPQVAASSFLRGAALSYFSRQIATGANTPSGRYFLNLDKVIEK